MILSRIENSSCLKNLSGKTLRTKLLKEKDGGGELVLATLPGAGRFRYCNSISWLPKILVVVVF